MICPRLFPFLALLSSLGPAAAQDQNRDAPPAARALTFDDLYGNRRLDLTGDYPRGLAWIGPERYLAPLKREAPRVVDAATGRSRPVYDAAAVSAALTAAGARARLAEAFARSPAGLNASLDDSQSRAIVRSADDLYLVDFGGPGFGADSDAAPAAVRLTDTPQVEELPALSPDGRTVAFVREFDLYTIPLIGAGDAVRPGPEVRLTVGGSDLIRHGRADWVYFEELYNRSWKGFRWSPDSERLAVMEYDDRAVGTFAVLDQAAPTPDPGDATGQRVETTRYPKTGTTNPTVRLGVVAATGGPVRWIDWGSESLKRLADLGRAPGDGGGLIAHYGWFPGGDRLYGYLQDRVQSTLSVRAVDVPANGPLGEAKELLNETDGAWVQSPGDLRFLPDGSFLIASTRDGWRHLYRYAADGAFLNAVTLGAWEMRAVDRVVTDDGGTWIYFTGTKDDPRGEFLYRVRPDAAGLTRLTPAPGRHSARVAPGGDWFLDTYSAHDTPPRVELRIGDGAFVRLLGEANPSGLSKTARGDFRWVEIPVPATSRSDGGTDPAGTLHGYLLTPPGLDLENPDRQNRAEDPSSAGERAGSFAVKEGERGDVARRRASLTPTAGDPAARSQRGFRPGSEVPVWVTTYGGPHTPTVKDDWGGGRGWEHLLATNGIAVLKVDPRAASGRGWAAAWAVHKRLGEQETADMIAAADWLRARPWCDGERIGLSGHSYGGYLTARVLTHSDRYAAGIAGGSVTAFANYDTIYTERLMDVPAANPDGYALTDLSKRAGDLHGRLLLIHGGMDDNVHPQNAWQFAAALQERGKDFGMMVYPRSRHGISGTHYRRLKWDFIRETMLGE